MYKKMKRAFTKYERSVLDYLENKYGEKFEIVGAIGECFGTPGDRWGVRPLNGSERELFSVVGSRTENGYQLADSYYSVLVQNEYEEFVYSITAKHFQNVKLKVYLNKEGANPCVMDKSTKLPDICLCKHEDHYCFSSKITVIVSGFTYNPDEHIREICAELAKARLMCWITFIFEGGDHHIYSIDNKFSINKIQSKRPGVKIQEREAARLTTPQIERLCAAVYLNGIINNQDLGCLGDIMLYMRFFGLHDSKINGRYPCAMTELEWNQVISDIIDDDALFSLRIVKSADVTEMTVEPGDALPGHRAVCFMDDSQNAYVIFRGTSGDYEWYDNAEGVVYSDTTQQIAAAGFINELWEKGGFGIKHLTAAGHSKGGNKAQYAALTTKDGYVNKCVSIDGQGFSPEFMEKYKANIRERKHLLELIAEQRDVVNCLAFNAADTTYYRGFRGGKTPENPHGESILYFHCPDALRGEDGQMAPCFNESYVSGVLNTYTEYLLTAPGFEGKRLQTAEDLTSLFIQNDKVTADDISDAFRNIAFVFFELIACNNQFKNDIMDLIYHELDVLIATKQSISLKSGKDFGVVFLTKLAKSIMDDNDAFNNFLEVSDFFVKLVKEILPDDNIGFKMIEFLIEFIGGLLKFIGQGAAYGLIKNRVTSWQSIMDEARSEVKNY